MTSAKRLGAYFLSLLAAVVFHGATTSTAYAEGNATGEPRIASIGGDVTEILYALGYDAHIVAVDSTSVYPGDALKTKKNLGYMRALSSEGVLSVSPTLIIASEKSGPPEVIAALKASSVKYISIAAPDSPEGVGQRVKAIAEAVGAQDKASVLLDKVKGSFDALAARRAKAKSPVRVLFLLSLQNGKATAAGAHTAADEVIKLAGGENAAAGFDGYKPLSDEAATAMAPEAILVMNRGQQPGDPGESVEARVAAMQGLSATPAVRNKKVLEVDGAALLQFGPRTADSAQKLLDTLHPELVSASDGH